MPATKNAMTRYKILDDLLSNRYHNYSLDDLTEEVNRRLSELYPDTNGVVRRTIEKDIYYIECEGPFMAEIERYAIASYNPEKDKTYTKQCLRYANPSYSIFKKDLSDDEEYLLREALSLLGHFEGLPNLDALEGLRLGLGVKHDERKIISFTKSPQQNSSLLGQLFTCISQKQVVKLSYHRFQTPEEVKEIVVYPYLIKEYNHRWFLYCQAETGKKLLCYSLDRVNRVEPLPSHKYADFKGDINDMLEEIVGVTYQYGTPILHIIIWVSEVSMDYVLTKPIHVSQRRITGEGEELLRKRYCLNGGMFFSLDCKDNYELERELTSFGKELVVLRPTELQDKIWNKIVGMNEIYSKLRTLHS